MKKFLLPLIILSGVFCSADALEAPVPFMETANQKPVFEAKPVSILPPIDISNFKYTVIKTTSNYTPIRDGASVNAKRFSHLKKGVKVFSDETNNDFYRVDLGLDRYYWIEKKYADVQTTAKAKEITKIDDIKISEDLKFYTVKIKVKEAPPYNEIETSQNSLDFIIYDSEIDKENLNTKISANADFKISKDEFNNLKISYFSNKPLVGHEVSFENGYLILKVKKPFKIEKAKPLKNVTVVIDPGHGGRDSGACAFNLKEKDLNLEISKKLKDELAGQGANVILTRETDVDVDLYKRVDFAKEKNADFLISIHQNSLPNRNNVDKKHGIGTYYYNKESYPLAVEIKNSLQNKTGFRDDGVNLSSLALTRAQNPLCVLVECGYIIHPEESKKLNDPNFQKIVAEGISEGMKNYLKNNF